MFFHPEDIFVVSGTIIMSDLITRSRFPLKSVSIISGGNHMEIHIICSLLKYTPRWRMQALASSTEIGISVEGSVNHSTVNTVMF